MASMFLGCWLTALSLVAASAQPAPPGPAAEDPDWVAVDGPHIDYQSFLMDNALLDSRDPSMQDRALDHLENVIRNAQTSQGDQNLITLLARASLTPSTTLAAPGTDQPPNQPQVRVKGIRLLTLLGGEGARTLLARIASVEPDPAVLSETYYGMRKTKTGITPDLLQNMVRHLGDPFPEGPNDGLIQEILRYVTEIQGDSGNLANRELFDAILAVNQNRRYLQKTNDLALKTLKVLMGMQ